MDPGFQQTKNLVEGENDRIESSGKVLLDINDERGSLSALLASLLASLPERHADVFRRRQLTARQATLEEIGSELDLTRERVRQLEGRAIQSIAATLDTQPYGRVQIAAREVLEQLGVVFYDASDYTDQIWRTSLPEGEPTEHKRLLLWAAGYDEFHEGFWWHHSVSRDAVDHALRTALEGEPQTPKDTAALLEPFGFKITFAMDYIMRHKSINLLAGSYFWGRPNIEIACILLLEQNGSPMTAEELLELSGLDRNLNSVRNTLATSDRVVKVGRLHFGLAEWGLDEYTGTSDEIVKAIETHGGLANISTIAREIALRTGVRENSVQMYCKAPRFVIVGNQVRMRRRDEPFTPVLSEISAKPGTYLSDGRLSVLFQVGSEDLRGSGRPLPQDVAWVLGAKPNQGTEYSASDFAMSVSWPDSAPDRATIGGLRHAALSTGAKQDDTIRLDFELNSRQVTATLINDELLASSSQIKQIQLLTGATSGTAEALYREVDEALGEPAQRLTGPVALLRARGDNHVGELLEELTS